MKNKTLRGSLFGLLTRSYLLFTLVQNKGIVLSREQLLRKVWGNDFLGDDRTVDTHIKMLRSALGPYRGFIVTMRGAGYKFEAV